MDKRIKSFSPLTEATYYILVAFTKPLHGYGVIKKVEEMTSGRLILAAGTLYGVVNTLLKHKLIELVSFDIDAKKKKEYVITDLGKDLLFYEINRLNEMVKNGEEVI
jgi:DNA-binding PadR family transcriptional regulator